VCGRPGQAGLPAHVTRELKLEFDSVKHPGTTGTKFRVTAMIPTSSRASIETVQVRPTVIGKDGFLAHFRFPTIFQP